MFHNIRMLSATGNQQLRPGDKIKKNRARGELKESGCVASDCQDMQPRSQADRTHNIGKSPGNKVAKIWRNFMLIHQKLTVVISRINAKLIEEINHNRGNICE